MPSQKAVLSKGAPAPSPLMSQAIISNGMVYSAGSLGIDPQTGTFVPGGAFERTVRPSARQPYPYSLNWR